MGLKKILSNIGCTALGTVAPPFGGMAANLIKDVLGLEENSTEKEIVKALEKATPEQVLALKEADNKFAVEMKKLDVDLIKLDKEDSKDARGFAERVGIKTVNSLAFANTLLVIITIVGIGYLVSGDSLDNIKPLTASLLTLAVREVFAKQEQIYNFFFGSSSGSRAKDDIIGKK